MSTLSQTPTDQQRVAELYALLAKGFEHPSEAFYQAVKTGKFDADVRTRLEQLGVTVDPEPALEVSHGDLREAYLRTFEAFAGPSAPPVESFYEPWWDERDREILSGPAEADMRRRFNELAIDVPNAYPEDHLALELEYASLLLEAGNEDAYAAFHREHFDWIPDFVDRVEATVDDPFYAWIVSVLERTIDRVETWVQTSLEDAGDVEAGSIPPASERDPSEVNGDEQ